MDNLSTCFFISLILFSISKRTSVSHFAHNFAHSIENFLFLNIKYFIRNFFLPLLGLMSFCCISLSRVTVFSVSHCVEFFSNCHCVEYPTTYQSKGVSRGAGGLSWHFSFFWHNFFSRNFLMQEILNPWHFLKSV